MSGPKTTNYEIERRRREELERQRQIQIENQKKVNQRNLQDIRSRLGRFTMIRQDSLERVNTWIIAAEHENSMNNFRGVLNQIRGIENFISKLNGIEQNILSREIERKRIADEKSRREEEQKESVRISIEELRGIKDDLEKVKLFPHVIEWINEAESAFRENNVAQARNGVNGINSFIEKHSSEIEKKLKIQNRNEILKERLNSVLEEKDIMTDGIRQRVKMYSEMIKDGEETGSAVIKQIDDFLSKVAEIREKYDQKKSEMNFVKEAIVSGFDGGKGSESGGNVTGTVGNTPVKITFDEGNKIIFNIDESKGGCMSVIDKIEKALAGKGIGIGDIFIQRTGQTIKRTDTAKNPSGKVRA